jgi:predicted GIY-YIG superfamily endonuclease
MGLLGFLGKKKAVNYSLIRKGRSVDIGVTNNPKRRNFEHRKSGKKYDYMKITSKITSRRTALKNETRNLNDYRKATGRRPKYNKTWNGKFN